MLDRFDDWQVGDKYLSQDDDDMAEAIKNLRFKQNQVHEKEFREMADGAQQTIKTMQEMIQQKNEYIRKKEDHITNLRDQMLQ